MRSRWKWRAAAVLLLAIVSRVTAVTLNKCCDIGLALQHPDASCKTDIYDDDWLPFIYASNPQGGFSHTSIPEDSNIISGSRPVCKDGKLPTLINSPPEAPAFVLLDNDILSLLMLHGSEESPPIFAPDEFCVDRQSALVCGAASQQGIRKCCGPSAAYSETNGSCVHGEIYDSVEINAVTSAAGFPICHNVPSGFYIVAGNIEGNLTAVVDKNTGELQLAPPPTAPLDIEEYCIERVVERPLNMISVFVCAPPLPERTPIRPEDHSNDIRFTLYPAGLAISAFFLAATLATGCLLPKAHHALHWRCQTCHVACLLVGDVLLATVQLAGAALPPEACKIMAVTMHFFFLSAFFWLNAMCFNIWWTFRDLRPMSADPGQERFRYRAYSVYAWGGPLMIAGLAVLLDNLPGLYDDVTGGLLRPRFGERRCWFYGDLEIFTFFHGPVGVLLLLNLVLFTATTRELTCGLWRREGVKSAGGGGASSQASSERSTLGRVCLKLVIVMGVTWIADVVSWAVGGPAYVWFVTDMVNALQGVLIFIVVGCQPQVWAAVKRLWWCSRGSGPAQGSTAANPMSSSSQGAPSTMAVEPSSPTAQTQEPPVETIC